MIFKLTFIDYDGFQIEHKDCYSNLHRNSNLKVKWQYLIEMNFNFILTNIFIRFIIKNGDGTPCSGGVTYETEYTFFSEDAAYILDIGKRE